MPVLAAGLLFFVAGCLIPSYVSSAEMARCSDQFPHYDAVSNSCYQRRASEAEDLQNLALGEMRSLVPDFNLSGVRALEPIFVFGAEGSSQHFYIVALLRKDRVVAFVRVGVPAGSVGNIYPVLGVVNSIKEFAPSLRRVSGQVFPIDVLAAISRAVKRCKKPCQAYHLGLVGSPHFLFGNDWFEPYHELRVNEGGVDSRLWVNAVTGRVIDEPIVKRVVQKSQLGFIMTALHSKEWLYKERAQQDRIVNSVCKSIDLAQSESLYDLYSESIRLFGNPPDGLAFSTEARKWYKEQAEKFLNETQILLLFH